MNENANSCEQPCLYMTECVWCAEMKKMDELSSWHAVILALCQTRHSSQSVKLS